ncbi:MAG: hypothetical protein MR308_11205 [Lachnospiraceae bacterium]|nr:hypothetical protein [Lachnospiraceae bacterium]
MTKLIIYLLFLLCVCAVTWVCHKVISENKYDLELRFLHCRYLAAYLAAIFFFCNRYTFSYLLLLVDKIINWNELSNLWNTVLPMRRYELVYLVLTLILSNLLIILLSGLLFWLIRLLFCRRKQFMDTRDMDWMLKIVHLPWVVTGLVYKDEEDEGTFRVTDRGFTMSLWAKRMKYAFLLWELGEIVFLTCGIFSESEFFMDHSITMVESWYLLPMIGFILFEEIQYYLEGNVEYEAGSFGAEDISETLEGNMEVLLHLYQNEFRSTSALLASYGWKDMKVIRDGLVHNGLNRNQIDECDQPEILTMLNNQMRESGVVQNTAFQNALIALLNGQSINVRDYIQGEFMLYLAVYMNFFVSQEKTFLVLCQSRKKAQKIKKELTKALNQINKIYSIWRIADIDGADSNEEMSILVCSYLDLVNHKLLAKRQDFFRTLSAVVLTDGPQFCAQGNVQKELIFAELAKVKQALQYILISGLDSDSLRTAFEYYINQELIPFKNDQLQNNMYVMLWAEDSGNKIQRALGIGQEQSPYLGTSIPLALVGAKYDLPCIHIFTSDKKGYHTYQDAMTMSYQEILGYLGSNLDLDKMIRYNSFSVSDRANLEMLILYDSEYNFYNLLWAWMKYGGKEGTLIHVVSPAYMLREYFVANLKSQVLRNNDFDALISYYSGLKQSRFLNLLLDLCNAGVDEEELMKKNREYHWGYRNVTALLADCLKNVLNLQEFYNIYECFQFEEYCSFDVSEDCFVTHTIVKLTDENIRRRIQEKLALAKLVTKNNLIEYLPVLRENVYNYYLPGQIVPINGFLQRVVTVNDGMVFTEQTMPVNKEDYLQAGEFKFRKLSKVEECVDMDILDFNLFTADVERLIYGYWSSTREIAFLKEGVVHMNSICDSRGNPVRVKNQNVQILQIRMRRDCFGERQREAVLLAGFMLRELFKTLFPENHMNLHAVVEHDPEQDYWTKIVRNSSSATLEEKVQSIVPFIRREENITDPNPEYLTIYVVEFSSLELGMISSLYANRMKVFQMMASYLTWYLGETQGSGSEEEAKEGGKATYLNLGGSVIAPCFAPEELLAFCKKVLPVYEEVKETPCSGEKVRAEYTCTFCGKPALFTHKMSDGRKMCRSCKQQQLGLRDELKELYLETVDFLCKGYHIKLRKNIHLRLKSAETIRKHCETSGGGRILGFYQPRNHELWIESRGPRNAVQDTMIHELTHAWQFDNLDVRKLNRKYPTEALKLLEGHSSYMEIDAMRKLGEVEYAEYLERELLLRNDEYGEGYRMLKEHLQSKEKDGSHWTPYEAMKDLVENL